MTLKGITTDLPSLPQYEKIENALEVERKTILRIRKLEEDDDLLRSTKEAKVVLRGLQQIQTLLWNFFSTHPSLISLFNDQFVNFGYFLQHEYILETCFFEDYLVVEKELFYFDLKENLPEKHQVWFEEWIETKKNNHEKNQDFFNEMNMDVKERDMACLCNSCIAHYRSNLRKLVVADCMEVIDESEKEIRAELGHGIEKVGEIYRKMNRNVEQKIHRMRYGLKRSSLKKIESKIKYEIKERFSFKSELTGEYIKTLKPFFTDILKQKNIKEEFITDEEYERFFSQQGSDVWKGDRHLKRVFDKFTGSILLLKRRDISSKILREYLGEFWVHSRAREFKRKIIYHRGPTNSGKTYHAVEALCQAENGCYLAPLRLLAVELFDTMNAKGVPTSLLTGEEVIDIPGSTHYASTIEMAKLQHNFNCCVIDEIQMLADSQRGWAWTRALVSINAREVHLCGDSSALDLVENIVNLCGDELEIKEYQRMTKLEVEKQPITLKELNKSDAIIVFSRRSALKFKQNLERLGFKVSIVYGRLGPEVRREQARKFDQNETDIIVSTDAIAMGMNLPIKRIVFSTLTKFIDSKEHDINQSEIKQIAGRAGRYKRFPTGYVTCLSQVEDGIVKINQALQMTLTQKKRSMVGPDLDIFSKVNSALKQNGLFELSLTEFLRLFNTMSFRQPFYCVDLKEMIEVTEMVEDVDTKKNLTDEEMFGFSCAPVNLGLMQHTQYFIHIVGQYVINAPIKSNPINYESDDIDYLETGIKCVELYQWLARHFNQKNFEFNQSELLDNKSKAVEKLNSLLSDIIVATCDSCRAKLPVDFRYSICEDCFKKRRFFHHRKKDGFYKKSKKSSKKRTTQKRRRAGFSR